MGDDIRQILDHIIAALPALLIFLVGFAWHTRSLIARLEEQIKTAQQTADAATNTAQAFNELYQKEHNQRRDMGVQLWDALNQLKHQCSRTEVLLEERHRRDQR